MKDTSPPRRERLAVCAVLAVMAAQLISLAYRTSVTVDEPAHLVSAHLYWSGEDRLYPGDMPPMIKIAAGWVPHAMNFRLPPRSAKCWNRDLEWDVALEVMDKLSGPQIVRLFFWSRLPLIIFPLACCALIWWWGRQIVHPWAALAAATAFSMAPTVLGHGALFKNDLAATFGYLVFWYRVWCYWRAPDSRNALWIGVGLLAAVLAKLSMFILVPIAVLIILGRTVMGRLPWTHAAKALGVTALVVFAGIQVTWQFDTAAAPEKIQHFWHHDPGIPAAAAKVASATQPFPIPFRLWHGLLSLLASNTGGSAVWFLGERLDHGHPLYFVAAMVLKVPVALLLLKVLGICLLAWKAVRRELSTTDLFWIAPAALYIALASMTNLQLGIRLILPGLAFLFFFAALAAERLRTSKFGRVVLLGVLLFQAGRTADAYPFYISHFNLLAGGGEQGLRYLSDSNLDWGQDLRELLAYVKANGVDRVKVAYFGADNAWSYPGSERLERVAVPWNPLHVEGRRRIIIEPGYYAISATFLSGHLFAPAYRDYFATFRVLKPVGKAGDSIFIYRVG